MRNAIALLILVGVGVGVWQYLQRSTGNEIKAQMLLILDDMDLAPLNQDEVAALVLEFHDEVFDRALDVSKKHGQQFDTKLYYDELFALVVERLREKDNDFLANKIQRQQAFHSLIVTER